MLSLQSPTRRRFIGATAATLAAAALPGVIGETFTATENSLWERVKTTRARTNVARDAHWMARKTGNIAARSRTLNEWRNAQREYHRAVVELKDRLADLHTDEEFIIISSGRTWFNDTDS